MQKNYTRPTEHMVSVTQS